VKGHYISYDALTEKYLVTNGAGETKSATGAPQARVRAIIQPKGKGAAPVVEKRGEQLELRGAQGISPNSIQGLQGADFQGFHPFCAAHKKCLTYPFCCL